MSHGRRRAWASAVVALGGLFGLLPLLSAGCAGDEPTSFCEARCDCQGCSMQEREDCVDDVEDAARLADHDGCADGYAEYVSCYVSEGTCEDGVWITSACASLGTALRSCSGRAATFVKSVCDEARDKLAGCGLSGGGPTPCSKDAECVALCSLARSCDELVNAFPGSPYVTCVNACYASTP